MATPSPIFKSAISRLSIIAICAYSGCIPRPSDRGIAPASLIREHFGTEYFIPTVQSNSFPVGSVIDTQGGDPVLVFSPSQCLSKFLQKDGRLNIVTNGQASLPSLELTERVEAGAFINYLNADLAAALKDERIASVKAPRIELEQIPVGLISLDSSCQLTLHGRYQDRIVKNSFTNLYMVAQVLTAVDVDIEFSGERRTGLDSKLTKYGAVRLTRQGNATYRISMPVFLGMRLARLKYIDADGVGILPPPLATYQGNSAAQRKSPATHIIVPQSRPISQ